MDIPDIDFNRIRSLGVGGQRDGFEQLICRQVAQEPPEPGATFVSLHGAGGDGGVECFWTIANGNEHGWQAKYWTSPGDVDKAQLDKSVKAALEQHPKLTRYTFAIPVDPTGPTGRRGASLLEKINNVGGWLEGWQMMAAGRGMSVQFEFEWATNVIARLERLDASGAQRRYWFGVDVLSDEWWQDRLDDAVNAARPRYMPELNIEVPAARAIAALCSDDEWWADVLDQAQGISYSVDRLRYADSEAIAADLEAARAAAVSVIDAVSAWESTRTTDGFDSLASALDAATASIATQEALEVEAMDAAHGEWDSPGWRQWQSEYMVRFPAAGVDALRELAAKISGAASLLISPVGRLAGTQVALMTGAAGIGKTYLAIDAVIRRRTKSRPSVVMHGRWFNDHEPLAHLRDVLQMPPDLTSEEAIALLDESARAAGAPALLVIDALNDTRPRSLWRDNLDRLIAVIGRYPNVRLLLTARTHYVAQVVPPGLTLARIDHTGFEGVEFEAVSEYAAYYGLEPPTSPPIHGEFDNPLYLRLVCEALKADNRLSLDQADMGLGELTRMVLDNANAIISDRIDASPSDRVAHRAMHSLAAAIADQGGAPLSREDAQATLSPIWSDLSAEKSLLDALIAQGLVEEDVVPDGSTYGADIIAITFERIGHHLIVSDALAGATDAEGIREQLASRLGLLLGLDTAIDIGLLEATSVVIAERFGMELTDFEAEIGSANAVSKAVIAGIGWRSTASITAATGDLIVSALSRRATFMVSMSMLFRLAARPGHPLNAAFLHGYLNGLSMGTRDEFLVGWLHVTHDTNGAVDRLIRWGREKSLDQVGEETTRLWVTALLWTTSATDRRVRDWATVAAARLLSRFPAQATSVLERFGPVNDEWVVERALEIAYSSLLLSGSDADWAAAAEVVWDQFFSVPADLTPNAAVRDAARSILEGASDRAVLSPAVTAAQFRPPYDSPWPPIWPTEAEIESYDSVEYPKLVHSTTADDFYRYQLEHHFNRRDGIDAPAAARWVVTEVIRLGYDPGRHRDFDSYVLGKFGPGRGKPAWIERIGKKYQWIALNRLIGIVTDHAPESPRSWDPPPAAIPGPAATGLRQIDPTVVEFDPVTDRPRAWVPNYKWAPTTGSTDAEWVAVDADLPTIAVAEAERNGVPFVVLAGNYSWDNATEDSKRTRGIWINLNSHLVNTADLPTAVAELENRDLTGHETSRLPSSYDGYVGEFPFGHHHGSTIHVVEFETRECLSVPIRPAVWEILGEHEYAPGDYETISLDAPSPAFFGLAPGDLHWNGRNGWIDSNGRLIASVRHTVNAGQNELLMDQDWLEQWLSAQQKSIVWIENTGKDAYRRLGLSASYPGALTRSRVITWTPGADIVTSPPGWQRIPARGE